MRSKLHVLLIGNYPNDCQESMQRFSTLLLRVLQERGLSVEFIAPKPITGRLKTASSGLGKWLGYIDKYLLFPIALHRKLSRLGSRTPTVIHICDHSNAPYSAYISNIPAVITCHDLGAIRGAIGEDTDCPASRTGQILQKWIRNSLGRAQAIACVSSATRRDVERLIRTPNGTIPHAQTILLGLNSSFSRMDAVQADDRLSHVALGGNQAFLLHVGSSLSRKNRDGIIRIFARIKDQWPGTLVFAGGTLPASCWELASSMGIRDRIVEVISPSHEVLEALYNRAFAFLFPSKFEGFGWPLIEAQACGCPVLSSDAGSLGEVAGESAFVRSWQAEEEFAAEILRMAADESCRQKWIERGLVNLERFRTERMIADYVQLYEDVLQNRLSREDVA